MKTTPRFEIVIKMHKVEDNIDLFDEIQENVPDTFVPYTASVASFDEPIQDDMAYRVRLAHGSANIKHEHLTKEKVANLIVNTMKCNLWLFDLDHSHKDKPTLQEVYDNLDITTVLTRNALSVLAAMRRHLSTSVYDGRMDFMFNAVNNVMLPVLGVTYGNAPQHFVSITVYFKENNMSTQSLEMVNEKIVDDFIATVPIENHGQQR